MNLGAILPHMILAAAAVLVLLALAIRRNHATAFALTALGFGVAFASLWLIGEQAPHLMQRLLVVDLFSLFVSGLVMLAGLGVAFLAYHYLAIRNENREEFYAMLLIAVLGAVVLAGANHFVTLFLGVEVLSVALYVMISYLHDNPRSLEAGIKYVVLAGASSAFLLFGLALIYTDSGTMDFTVLASRLELAHLPGLYVLVGLALVVAGVGFKLAVAPFHMWAADVYEGAPAPVTALIATVSKSAVVAVLVRFFVTIEGYRYGTVVLAMMILAVLSMLIGNLLALLQGNVKRILAYSSIAHLGYLLVGFLAGGQRGIEGVLVYLVAYTITTLGAFGVIGLLSGPTGERIELTDYRGLFWERPWVAAAFTAMLLSLAGIPLTAGFVGKFFVLTAGVGAAQWVPVIALVVGSALGIFYYTRIIATMFARGEGVTAAGTGEMPITGGLALTILTLALFAIGMYPTPLLNIVRTMVLYIP